MELKTPKGRTSLIVALISILPWYYFGVATAVWIEQEPGSGGKESAEATIRRLAGYDVYAERVTGSKEVRAEPFIAQAEGHNIKLVNGTWNETFLDEASVFPVGRHDDQIDAAVGAFSKLVDDPNDLGFTI